MMVWSLACISVLFVLVIIAVVRVKPWRKRQTWESDDELRQQLIDSGIYRPRRKFHLLKFVSSHKKATSRRYNFHKLKYKRNRDNTLEAIHEENENTAQEMKPWPPTTA